MRIFIIGFLIIFSGCSSTPTITNENINLIKKIKNPINVKKVTFKGKNKSPDGIECRLEGDLEFPEADNILTYVKKSLEQELTKGNKLKTDGDTFSIDFQEIKVSTMQKYFWHFKGVLKYKENFKKDFKVSFNMPSVMWSKYDCNRAVYDYNRAQGELFRAVYKTILNEL